MSNLTPETPAPAASSDITPLLGQLRQLIADARTRALRAVDSIQVRTCWEIGRHIVEFEQGGQARAAYGKRLLPMLAEQLTAEFGKGFDASNLRYMRLFYLAFPKCDALRHELSWTHYRLLTRVDNEAARQWYMREAAEQNWSSRAPRRQSSPAPGGRGLGGGGTCRERCPICIFTHPSIPSRQGRGDFIRQEKHETTTSSSKLCS